MNDVTKIDAYRTTDGQTFEDEGEARAHQAEIDVAEDAKTFAESRTDKAREHTRIVNTVVAWEAWRAANAAQTGE